MSDLQTVTERGIIMTGESVRAILDGRKTMTRRVVKNPDWFGCLTGDCPHFEQSECDAAMSSHCPYGRPGDRLWVREAWFGEVSADSPDDVMYRADGDAPDYWTNTEKTECRTGKWCSPIFLPRRLSRLTLEITEVRVERLQDITAKGCIAEGIPSRGIEPPSIASALMYLHDFEQAWDRINGKRAPWESNCWVWVISFTRVMVP